MTPKERVFVGLALVAAGLAAGLAFIRMVPQGDAPSLLFWALVALPLAGVLLVASVGGRAEPLAVVALVAWCLCLHALVVLPHEGYLPGKDDAYYTLRATVIFRDDWPPDLDGDRFDKTPLRMAFNYPIHGVALSFAAATGLDLHDAAFLAPSLYSVVALLAIYLAAREAVGVPLAGAFAASGVLLFPGFYDGYARYTLESMAFVFLALLLWLLLRICLRGRRDARVTGLAFAFLLLAVTGHYFTSFMVAGLVAVFALAHLLRVVPHGRSETLPLAVLAPLAALAWQLYVDPGLLGYVLASFSGVRAPAWAGARTALRAPSSGVASFLSAYGPLVVLAALFLLAAWLVVRARGRALGVPAALLAWAATCAAVAAFFTFVFPDGSISARLLVFAYAALFPCVAFALRPGGSRRRAGLAVGLLAAFAFVQALFLPFAHPPLGAVVSPFEDFDFDAAREEAAADWVAAHVPNVRLLYADPPVDNLLANGRDLPAPRAYEGWASARAWLLPEGVVLGPREYAQVMDSGLTLRLEVRRP